MGGREKGQGSSSAHLAMSMAWAASRRKGTSVPRGANARQKPKRARGKKYRKPGVPSPRPGLPPREAAGRRVLELGQKSCL